MFNLDLTNVKADSFGVLPNGDYKVVCEEAVIKETKDGLGEYISCQFVVAGGEYDGRKVFENFNIKNKSDKAVQIGLSKLKAFIMASGRTSQVITGVDELCGLKAVAVVKKKTDDFGEKNFISGYKEPEIDIHADVNDLPF